MTEKKDTSGLFRLNLGQIRAELKDMELNDCRVLIVLMATEIGPFPTFVLPGAR
ncbi:hypothetical protein [Ktedonobacter racemifer]|uniref:Uncharacterized protein n=1 Tax=Ktedonobacter racemifer DSM 44963 TaxID=485913 RepID=D6U1Q8_KTERA|nr:hypothetical protein [Ktedonobacter racemifer]EFH82702.1 hypothetical protein Krac_3540 [Ktedonobacter racemifer DSM 44963]